MAFDYGNNLRAQASRRGVRGRLSRFPVSFRSTFVRYSARDGAIPLGRPVGRSGGHLPHRPGRAGDVSARRSAGALDPAWPASSVAFQGLPARICWLGYGERARLGLRFNEMVGSGELKAPIVIGRDHLDAGSVASPNRETEGMRDGCDAIADWPILNALVNTACGASWVSVHHGGGVGIGYSLHAGMVVVADGSRGGRGPPRARADQRSRHGRGATPTRVTPKPSRVPGNAAWIFRASTTGLDRQPTPGQHRFYAGIDLHARTMHVCILAHDGDAVCDKNLPVTSRPCSRRSFPCVVSRAHEWFGSWDRRTTLYTEEPRAAPVCCSRPLPISALRHHKVAQDTL